MTAILAVGIDNLTQEMLRLNNYLVEHCDETPEEFEITNWCDRTLYDVIIIDLNVFGGSYVCRPLRRKENNIPVLGIARPEENISFSEQRALFMENGGDDLLRNPLNPRELLASTRAVLRRVYTQLAVDSVTLETERGSVLVDLVSTRAFVDRQEMHMTGQEARIMMLFATRLNRVLTKETIMNSLYSDRGGEPPEIKIVDVFICKLRGKLNRIAPGLGEELIQTIWGRGYIMNARRTVNRSLENGGVAAA